MAKPKELIQPGQMAKIVDAVEAGIKLQTIRLDENTVYILNHIFPRGKKSQESFITNLFLYTRLKKITHAGQTLYVKDLETADLLGYYNNNKVILVLNSQ